MAETGLDDMIECDPLKFMMRDCWNGEIINFVLSGMDFMPL